MSVISSPAGWVDLGLALLAFALIGLALWGLGRLAGYVLRFDLPRGADEFGYIWAGLAAAVGILALVNYALPITPAVGMALYGIGIAVALVELWRRRGVQVHPLYGVAVAAAAVWLAAQALRPPTTSDSGLYYFATIRWANEYPLVAGLGNLHGRLAFNQSLFVWIASLNAGPWDGHGFALANPFLCLVVLAEGLRRVGRKQATGDPALHLTWAVPLMLLPPVLWIMITRPLASAAPDVTSELLQLVIFVWVVRLLSTADPGQAWGLVRFVLVICALAVTVKLSNAAFAGTVAALALLYTFRHLCPRWVQVGGALIAPALLAGVWFGRGLLLSGCPLYPAALLCQEFPWSVPVEQAREEAAWIYSWARQPGLHYNEVLGSWAWLGPWARRMAAARVNLIYPVALAAVGMAAGAWLWTRQAAARRWMALQWGYLLTPVVLGVGAWLMTAPELRFAQGLIWLLPVAVWTPLLAAFPQGGRAAAWGLFALVNGPLIVSLALHLPSLTFTPGQGFAPIPEAALVQRRTDSGLAVYTPAEGYHCWDGPLPCTPYFNPGLHLLGEGLASGFARGPGESAAPR